ncbi:MAG: cupin domain-containing protein [Deltaproteobacteria bacterium]|nr:cupin domain-containing protein [Deltaproteobacteria bacterium]
MIRHAADLPPERRDNIRGGNGAGFAKTYLANGDMHGVAFVTEMTLEPGTDIGLHRHHRDEELYVVPQGHGTGLLDGERFAAGPGDAWLCKAGHEHGVVASAAEPLRFLAVLSAPFDATSSSAGR